MEDVNNGIFHDYHRSLKIRDLLKGIHFEMELANQAIQIADEGAKTLPRLRNFLKLKTILLCYRSFILLLH